MNQGMLSRFPLALINGVFAHGILGGGFYRLDSVFFL